MNVTIGPDKMKFTSSILFRSLYETSSGQEYTHYSTAKEDTSMEMEFPQTGKLKF